MIKKKLFIIFATSFLLIILTFFYLLLIDRNPSEIPSALLNKKIPKFEAKSLINEKDFISSEIFGNEIILVNFFSSWCKPCRDEHKYLLDFSNKVKVVGINYKDREEKALAWLKTSKNPYSYIAIDKNGKIAIDWGVYGIPETFLINSKGVIKYRHAGPINKKIFKKISLIIDEIKQ